MLNLRLKSEVSCQSDISESHGANTLCSQLLIVKCILSSRLTPRLEPAVIVREMNMIFLEL